MTLWCFFFTWLLGTIDHNLPRRSKRHKRTGSSLRPSPGQYSKGRTSTLPRFAFKTYPEKGFRPGKGESCLNVAFHWNKHVSSAIGLELNTIPRAAQQYASPRCQHPCQESTHVWASSSFPSSLSVVTGPVLSCTYSFWVQTLHFLSLYLEEGKTWQLWCWRAEEWRVDVRGSTCVY